MYILKLSSNNKKNAKKKMRAGPLALYILGSFGLIAAIVCLLVFVVFPTKKCKTDSDCKTGEQCTVSDGKCRTINPKKCTPECSPNGECKEGTCDCNEGFYGKACE